MRPSCMLLVLLVGVSLGEQALAQARVYRWTDAEGHVHYSDKPPQPVVGRSLGLVREEFGRSLAFEEMQTSSGRYVSARIESASAQQWNASECLFKTYALKTVFLQGETRQPAELVVTVCTGPQVERAALRQIEFRFPNSDARTMQKVQAVLTRTIADARRLTAPHPGP